MSSSNTATDSVARSGLPLVQRVIGELRQAAAFLVVGGIGFAVDAGTFNLLVFWGGHGPLFRLPLVAKILAIVAASVVTYFGNKWWTYAHKAGGSATQEYVLYAIFNVIAIALQLGCLGFSRYVLHLSTPLSDNISGTVIGQMIAVAFRYWAYGRFVFVDRKAQVA